MEDNRDNFDWVELLSWFIVIMIGSFMIACLMGCKTIQYVPVEKIQKETEYIDRLEVDTFYCQDSVIIEKKGDCEDKEHIRYVYNYKYIHDTCDRTVTDTIPYPVEIEKKLSRWEQFYLSLGRCSFPIWIILATIIILYIAYRLKRHV